MKIFKTLTSSIALSTLMVLSSCGDDDSGAPTVTAPETYVFERDGSSTVSFDGQTDRILMAEEIVSALKDPSFTEEQIDAMFDHQEGNDGFSDPDLNTSTKSVRNKTAASTDYFSANTTDASAIRSEFDGWIVGQVSEVFPIWEMDASEGVPGGLQEAGGGTVRYINEEGLEYDQAFGKSLIGALMLDQILNNYLSVSVLDAGDNLMNNDAEIVVEGESYTDMEHKWDEAYGYVYGTSANPATPNTTIGLDDSFLNKYIGRVEGDEDFAGIAEEIFDAFKLGRAAIVAGDYTVRDTQAGILREQLSAIIGIRSVYYLQQGKIGLEAVNPDMASVLHDLSEGFGFIYALQFTRNPNTNAPYFTRSEVQGFLDALMGDGSNGLWNVTTVTLDELSEDIASAFSFTVAQAGS